MFAAARLILATPLLGLVAVPVKLDSPGPIFFVQRRYGSTNSHFASSSFAACARSRTVPSFVRPRPTIRA
jgi:lipopolysaccharide/colanic/teichoic acid biosynthesis glycosyltransferase